MKIQLVGGIYSMYEYKEINKMWKMALHWFPFIK